MEGTEVWTFAVGFNFALALSTVFQLYKDNCYK